MKHSTEAAYSFLHRGTLLLSEIMSNGVRVDMDYIDKTVLKMKKRVEKLEAKIQGHKFFKKWRRMFGEKTNIRSDDQLSKLLNKLGYKTKLKTKSTMELYDALMKEGKEREAAAVLDQGRDSVSKAALEDIDIPYTRWYQKAKQLRTTIITKGLLGIKKESIQHKDGLWYVHPTYHFLPATYRTGCESPNMQNAPVREPWIADIVRQVFIPRPGNHIVENDLAQIEVRIFASYSKDKNLLKYVYDKSTDMHRDIAMEIFYLEKEQVSKNARYCAKNMMVFPQSYGSVYFQCAPEIWKAMKLFPGMGVMKRGDDKNTPSGRDLISHLRKHGIRELGDCTPGAVTRKGTLVHHLKQIEDRFWNERFTGFRDWKRKFYNDYLETGGFWSKTGIYWSGEFARNAVTNYPIQGDAFKVELWSMMELRKEIRRNRMKSLLIGEVHDCSIGDVPPEDLQQYLDLVKDIVEVRVRKAKMFNWIVTPLEVEAEVTPVDGAWSLKKEWVKKDNLWQLKI